MTIDLGSLDDDQRLAAEAPRGPVCILAGAGTGKTRTITYRIANLIDKGLVSPHRMMAVTFTARAAGEMRDRLNKMGIGGVQALTFHAAARRQLSYVWPQIAGDLPWRLLDRTFPIVARATKMAGLPDTTEAIRDVAAEIGWAKSSLIAASSYAEKVEQSSRTAPFDAEKIARAFDNYEKLKRTSEGVLLDFDDLLIFVAAAFDNDPGWAEEFRNQYRSFTVDEYQDVTPLQQRVLSAWLGDRDDLTVVGDANQTIYSFTGATPEYLLDFQRTYPHATVVRLERDYRSTPQIVKLANTVIAKAAGRISSRKLTLKGMKKSGPLPNFHAYVDAADEAQATVKSIKRLLDAGVPAGEIAVLYRINAQSVEFESALTDAGIGFELKGGEEFFRRAEILKALELVTRAAGKRNIPRDAVGPKLGYYTRLLLEGLGLTENPPDGARAREVWQSLDALAKLAEEIGTDIPDMDFPGLAVELKRRATDKNPPTVDRITLATIHAAKGLEWDAVFLVGCTDSLLPITFAQDAGFEQVEEERRLFYVGITRARRYLTVSWPLSRQGKGRAAQEKTRFLQGVVADSVEAAAAKRKSGKKTQCTLCKEPLTTPAEMIIGRCSRCASDVDESLVAALKAWRLTEAKKRGIPAFVVFTDATLVALAEARPTDLEELQEIPGIGPVKAESFGPGILGVIDRMLL